MELIERYIYAVTRHLLEKQREDIAKELRGLIEDMLSQRAEAHASDTDIEAVLIELGEPSALASKYSGKPRYLIGPEIFETYIMVLKIVLIAIAFGMLVALTVHYAIEPLVDIGDVFRNIIGSILSSVVEGFAWVTGIFALIEYFAVDINSAKWKKVKWKPSDLPEIPVKGALIKRSNPIVGMTFIVLFVIVFNFAPGLLSVYHVSSGALPIPLFNLTVLREYMILINIGFAVSIIKEIMKLVYGRYNLRFAFTNTVLSSVSLILMVIVFSNFHIWNWDFISSIEQVYGTSLPAQYDANQAIIIFAKVVLGIIIFSYGMETITTVVKTVKYNALDLKKIIFMGK